MGLQEKLSLYFIAGAGCPKGSTTSKSVSSMRGQRHSNVLIKECERQTVHPSATRALYVREWGRETGVLLNSMASCAGPAGDGRCHTRQDRPAELEEGCRDHHTRKSSSKSQ